MNPCRGGETSSDNSYRTLVGRSKDAGTHRTHGTGHEPHQVELRSFAGQDGVNTVDVGSNPVEVEGSREGK